MDVELDEPAAEGTSNAPHHHVDGQLPDVVPELGAIQRNVIIVQTQVTPDSKSGIQNLNGLLMELG